MSWRGFPIFRSLTAATKDSICAVEECLEGHFWVTVINDPGEPWWSLSEFSMSSIPIFGMYANCSLYKIHRYLPLFLSSALDNSLALCFPHLKKRKKTFSLPDFNGRFSIWYELLFSNLLGFTKILTPHEYVLQCSVEGGDMQPPCFIIYRWIAGLNFYYNSFLVISFLLNIVSLISEYCQNYKYTPPTLYSPCVSLHIKFIFQAVWIGASLWVALTESIIRQCKEASTLEFHSCPIYSARLF